MRGAKAFLVLSAFLLLMSGFGVLVYFVVSSNMRTVGGSPGLPAGKIVFAALFLFELFLVSFLTPAFTAGSLSGERERRTYDLLLSTPLSAGQIVLGKLGAALAYVVALIVASVPVWGTSFLMGGVAPEEVAVGLWIVLLTAVAFGAIGLFFSSIMSGTVASTVLAYAVVLLLTVGIPLLGLVTAPFLGRVASPRLLESPTVIYAGLVALSTNPFLAAGVTEGSYMAGKSLFFFTETFGRGADKSVLIVSPWLLFSAIYGLGSAALILVSARMLGRRK